MFYFHGCNLIDITVERPKKTSVAVEMSEYGQNFLFIVLILFLSTPSSVLHGLFFKIRIFFGHAQYCNHTYCLKNAISFSYTEYDVYLALLIASISLVYV